MYEIYLDESNGSIREEDDDIPNEDINIGDVKGDASGKVTDSNESEKKGDSDVDKLKSKSSPIKDEKETRDSKDAKDGKDSKESKEGKDSKDTRSSKDSKSSKDKPSHSLTSSGSNNVWVSGLSSSTRAAALQTLFKKYGKVLSAKIITNPRIPGSRAHGFITMETAEQAEKCIQNLNKTELDGKTISVSKNRPTESSSSSRHKSSTSNKKEKPKDKDSKSKSDENKDPDKEKSKDDSKKSDDKSSHDDDKKKKEKPGDKDKEKEKERQKDREKEKEKTKSREKEKDKDKSKDKEKEKKKDDDKDQSKEKSDRDKEKSGEKEKAKEKDRKDDKSKDDKDDDKKDESKDDKNKKDRSSKSPSRSRSRDRKRGSQSPPRKLLRRPMGRRMGPGFLGRRMNTRGRSASSRPNPVLLRRIETERAQRRRERDRDIQESKRRRFELIRTQREVERKAQEERDRLEREMVKLRIERERLEREKAELLRLEREKARLERERIEREREELRRKQFQLPHRIDDSPRGGRSGINKRPYDSRGGDPREIDLHWDDRKRMTAPSPVTPSGRASFNGAVASRMSDFDARGHNSAPYDNKGASYRRIKLDNPASGGGLRTEYDSRRDSGRHGTSSGGHDRDDRRNTGGPGGSGSGYYRDSSRMTGSSRDRDRRGGGGGGRDDWKSSHDNRRDRYLDKGLSSLGTSYSTGASYSGSTGDWASDRGSSSLSKLSYSAGPSVSESRSRGAGLGSSLMSGGNQMSDLYTNSSSIPMSGIMSHGGIGSTSGLTSDERPYLHSVRRF